MRDQQVDVPDASPCRVGVENVPPRLALQHPTLRAGVFECPQRDQQLVLQAQIDLGPSPGSLPHVIELALAVLVELMRREGFEVTVGNPQVVTRRVDGKLVRGPLGEPTREVGSKTNPSIFRKCQRLTIAKWTQRLATSVSLAPW